jgi:hypothetical protein
MTTYNKETQSVVRVRLSSCYFVYTVFMPTLNKTYLLTGMVSHDKISIQLMTFNEVDTRIYYIDIHEIP